MRTKKKEHFYAIETFVSDYMEEHGTAPSVREIAEGTGMSKSNASRYIASMREDGTLGSDGSSRNRIVTKEKAMDRQSLIRVPVLGAVSCGVPKFAEENIEEYVKLPVALFGSGNHFILRANGESMIEAGIGDGDLVLIRQQETAKDGQIVVALMEDEATLKRFYLEPERHCIRLHPENPTMEDIFVDDCIIQGVAVKVLKDLE